MVGGNSQPRCLNKSQRSDWGRESELLWVPSDLLLAALVVLLLHQPHHLPLLEVALHLCPPWQRPSELTKKGVGVDFESYSALVRSSPPPLPPTYLHFGSQMKILPFIFSGVLKCSPVMCLYRCIFIFWVLCKISPLENLFNPPNKFVLGLSQSLMSLQLGRGFKKWRGCGFFSKNLILWVFCKIFP